MYFIDGMREPKERISLSSLVLLQNTLLFNSITYGILTTIWANELHRVIFHCIKIIIHHHLVFMCPQIGKLYILASQHAFQN